MNHLVWKLGNGCTRTMRRAAEKKELTGAEGPSELALQSSAEYNKEPVDSIMANRPGSLIRETNNIKMSTREPIIQSNLNPFLNSEGYIADLEVHDKFLRPQDSNYNSSDRAH